MAAKLSDIIDAIEFISADPALESEAFLSLNSGEIFIRSPDFEEELENCPDDLDDSAEYRPSASDDVYAMFRRPGAYARFKDWAEREGLLDEWHRYEDESKTAAVREWCNENDIEFSE